MANYQVLFSGERKSKQLFSGRTVVIRSQLDQHQAQAWQDKLAQFGAICRIKDLTPKDDKAIFDAAKGSATGMDHTLRDITAAHLECPRCGHMQLDSSHCARCGVDLEQAFKQKRKEDLLIEKKIRELRTKRDASDPLASPMRVERPVGRVASASMDGSTDHSTERSTVQKSKKGVLSWFKK